MTGNFWQFRFLAEEFLSELIWISEYFADAWFTAPCSLALSGAATITFFYSLGEHGLQTALLVSFLTMRQSDMDFD